MSERWRQRPGEVRARPGACLLATVLVLAFLVACDREKSREAPSAPLNVLLIVVDDLRPDLGSYGHPVVQSPNIDRLAARGVRFDRAYSQFPACNPSRSSFLTGLRPSTLGVLDNEVHYRELRPEVVTLPELFRTNGYFTASVGKVFHGAGGRKGWQNPDAWDTALFPRGRRRARHGERRRFHFDSGESIGWVAAGGTDGDQPDGQVARQTVALLEQSRERPFFIAAGFLRPHTPMIAPARYFDLYPHEDLGLAKPGSPEEPQASGLGLGHAHRGRIDERGRLELLRAYYACISFVDAQIGRILEALDRLDLWRNTVVVLASDHGIHLGEHDWWSKNTLFEVAARVPLIVYSPPSAARGQASSALVELVDLYPTLAELARLENVPGVDGRSFGPVLEEPGLAWKVAAFTQAARGELAGYSVRTDRWRYTEWGPAGAEEVELYDHQADPGELRNLASERRHQAELAELRAVLDTIRPDGRER